jgi:hypothetical protein
VFAKRAVSVVDYSFRVIFSPWLRIVGGSSRLGVCFAVDYLAFIALHVEGTHKKSTYLIFLLNSGSVCFVVANILGPWWWC